MTNPVIGFINTIGLFLCGRVAFDKDAIGKTIYYKDQGFEVFRRVYIKNRDNSKAYFIIRFKPKNMTSEQNIKFSRLPMMIFMGFKGFSSKYWAVDYSTGLCQGFYEWETEEDATKYSKSIALRFMKNRSEKESVEYWIINKDKEKIDYRIE
jgi:hypothetical protein